MLDALPAASLDVGRGDAAARPPRRTRARTARARSGARPKRQIAARGQRPVQSAPSGSEREQACRGCHQRARSPTSTTARRRAPAATRPQRSRAASAPCSTCRQPAPRCRGTIQASTTRSVTSVESATPQMPHGPGEHERQHEVRDAWSRSRRSRSLAAGRARSGTASARRSAGGRAARRRGSPSPDSCRWNPAADPGLDQQVGDQEQRQREQEHQRRARPQPGEQQSALSRRRRRRLRARRRRGTSARSPRCRSRRRARTASPAPSRRRSAAEPSTMPTTITSVEKTIFCAMCTRKFEELKRQELAQPRTGDEAPRERSPGSSRRSQSSGSVSRTQRRAERERAEQDSPPQRGISTATSTRVQHGRDEVREVLQVPALLGDEQVVEEPERKASGERERRRAASRSRASQTSPCGAPTSAARTTRARCRSAG